MTVTTEHYADRLSRLIEERGPICAGLDPRPKKLGPELSIRAWAHGTVDQIGKKVAAFKPQIAFYRDRWMPLRHIVSHARGTDSGAIIIGDCKRGDIGSTAEAYAHAIFNDVDGPDAITLNPYLGADSLAPFVKAVEQYNKGLFVLVKTSNPGSKDLQDLQLKDGGTVCGEVAKMVDRLGEGSLGKCGRSRVGAVIGLTVDPMLIRQLRKFMPRAFFLMPGYGAQGGDPAVLEAALDEKGGGVLISASRSLTLPWDGYAPERWQERIGIELRIMKAELGVSV